MGQRMAELKSWEAQCNCHAQDATLSSIWHEGLIRDRSASRRVARMDIVTSTCTEKKRYIKSWLTLATSYMRVTSVQYIIIKSKSRVRLRTKTNEKRRTTSILAIPGCRPGTHPRSMKKKKKKQLQMNNQHARVK